MSRFFDIVVIVASQGFALLLLGSQWSSSDTLLVAVCVAVFGFLANQLGVYAGEESDSVPAWRVTIAWLTTYPIAILTAQLSEQTTNARLSGSLTAFSSAFILLVVLRLLPTFLRWIRAWRGKQERVAIFGAGTLAQRLARQLVGDSSLRATFVGLYDSRSAGRLGLEAAQLAGDLEKLVQGARNGEIDVVYICLPAHGIQRSHSIVAQLADSTADVRVAIDPEFDPSWARWRRVGGIQFICPYEPSRVGGMGSLVAKRIEDLTLSMGMLAVCWPILVLIALAIKVESAGPVLFRQRRYGLNGRPIGVWKFRTMRVADDGNQVRQAQFNDLRVTRLGSFLRRTSLDELPQLFNVLVGDMSIVGPRPHAVAHNEVYRSKIHGYMLRHRVKPGITGWAQVNGVRGEMYGLEQERMRVEYDLEYARSWSLLLDLKILLLTVFGSKSSQGAH